MHAMSTRQWLAHGQHAVKLQRSSDHDEEALAVFRGLLVAVPLGAAAWIGIIAAGVALLS